jgi:twitching motility protein PilT
MATLADAVIPSNRRHRFDEEGEVDFAHSVPSVGRFRANVFLQRGSPSMVLRKLRMGGPTLDEVGLPTIVHQLAEKPRGLVLVTGPTGSGKTTTLAAMIEHINLNRPVHIVTIEDLSRSCMSTRRPRSTSVRWARIRRRSSPPCGRPFDRTPT